MKKGLIRKGLVFSVIVLLIGGCITPVIGSSNSFDDTTPPKIRLWFWVEKIGNDWLLYFIADCSDNESGMDRVEFSIDDILMDTDFEEPFEWFCISTEVRGHSVYSIAYDKAGNNATDAFDFRSHSIDNEKGVSISSVSSKDISISNRDNNPPGIPIVIGPTGGKPGIEYTFTFNAIDSDGDDVRYIIDWGDGYIDTTTFAPSGYDVDASHMWDKVGVYHGSVKAEDIHGLQGPERYIKFGSGNSKDKEDCIDCQASNGISLFKAKLLLYKVRIVTNILLSSKLGEIPEIKENCQKILELINSNILLEPPVIECSILFINWMFYSIIGIYCNMLIPFYLYPIFPNLTLLIMSFGYYMYIKGEEYSSRAAELGCSWIWVGPEDFNRIVGVDDYV